MAQAATPFDFDEFETGAGPLSVEPSFTTADMEAAREAARAKAVDDLLVREAQEQTRLLENISEQFSASANEREASIVEIQSSVMETARKIISKICANVTAAQKAENALALLDSYLAKVHNQAPVRLILPISTPKRALNSIKSAISERNTDSFVSVEQCEVLSAGECRIEWRGGSAAFSSHAILNQIDSIFRSGAAQTPRNTRKGTPS